MKQSATASQRPKIELYHSVSARSFRPLWAMEELGLEYVLHMLPFPPRVAQREYLEVNPLGTVPALRIGTSLMTESVAMCHYLATVPGAHARLAVGPDEAEYADYLNLLLLGEATLTFPQTLVLRYRHFEPPERQQPQVADDYGRWFLARLKTLDARVESRQFLCAERFTMADISVGYALMLAHYVGLLPHASPAVQSYWSVLQTRPAFQRTLKAEHDGALAQGVSSRPSPAERPWEAQQATKQAQ